jgi:hypothetical protein
MHKHVHSSGRYSRSVEQARAGLELYITRDKADVITLTEQANVRHRLVIADACREHGYTAYQGLSSQDDCVIMLRNDRLEGVESWHDQLTTLPQNRATGGPIHHSITVLVRDKRTGKRFLYTVAHLTAGVESEWNTEKMPYRVRVWIGAQAKWSWLTLGRRRKYRARVAMVSDWNLNLERAKFRTLLKTVHPRLTLTWKTFPGPGTLGGRIIDATLTNMRIVREARLLPDDEASDHRPYDELLG